MSKYSSLSEMEKAHQQEVNEFPIMWVFAFSETEFIEKLSEEIKKRKPACTGISTLTGISKHVVSIGAGGFIFREDVRAMNEMFARHKAEREELLKEEKWLVQKIVNEMVNHEYPYTQDKTDTLMALGKSHADLENDEFFRMAWKKAEKKIA